MNTAERTAESAGGVSEESSERVVIVRAEVIDTVGHVFGNLFQRLYHLVDRVAETDSLTAEELRGNAGRLEGVLQLFLDYVSPIAPRLQAVPFADIGQSLARRVTEACGGRAKVECTPVAVGSALVDPGRLTRVFDLMMSRLQVRPGSEAMQIGVEINKSNRWLEIALMLPSEYVAPRNSEAELRWALAEKLVDLQGGSLAQHNLPAGETQWLITLPLQP
jgi:hypothetical protein